ncbi:MAG: OmpA family protein [Actinomycetota bacterium]
MSEVDGAGDLPRWSGTAVPAVQQGAPQAPVAQPPPVEPDPLPDDQKRRGRLGAGLALGVLCGLLLAAVGAGAYWFATREDEEPALAGTAAEAADEAEADGGVTTDGGDASGDDGEDVAAPSAEEDDSSTATTLQVDTGEEDEDAAGVGPGPDGTTIPIGEADGLLLLPEGFVPSDPNYETRIQANTEYAVVRGGKVYLYGFAPDEETLQRSAAVTAAVMGPDGYVVERVIDPDAPETEAGSVFVDDKVLFAFNSSELAPDSLPVLDLGVSLMLLNPGAEILVIARSDAVGSADTNLEISRRRGQAVVDYAVSQGVEPERLTIDARGEADASESDDEQMAALNRSVEFVVSGVAP